MMEVKVLSDEQVAQCATDLDKVITVNRQAFQKQDLQQATVPTRIIIPTPHDNGAFLFKPALVDDEAVGIKLVGVKPNNAKNGLPTIPGVILLTDPTTGFPLCMMNATYLTALRTAAGSAAVTNDLALKKASHLVVFGAGMQAKLHILTICHVRNIKHVSIWNRTAERAMELINSLKSLKELSGIQWELIENDPLVINDAVKRAHIIVTATNSFTPLFNGSDLSQGVHINAVGAYTKSMQELDETTIKRSRVISDNHPDEIYDTTGDFSIPLEKNIISRNFILGTAGQLFNGKIENVRRNANDITLFKSIGNAVQDIGTAALIYKASIEKEIGTSCSL